FKWSRALRIKKRLPVLLRSKLIHGIGQHCACHLPRAASVAAAALSSAGATAGLGVREKRPSRTGRARASGTPRRQPDVPPALPHVTCCNKGRPVAARERNSRAIRVHAEARFK